ncbi:Uncharacterized protein EbC_pEb17202090 (plasmid) [Erwinia billingiae Eb661]|uniref:Uncharacterized protein n=1 Tax=Erwinia billingiae (strain Eb661) TaxID=634500 RepID=D8MK64_ERWBE|nr:hypothetical protein [Erwinia billingiae]CAX53662.1 Uncharacterized protein EbC_pEb17202090 [Erwinia billingiae Eb661]
MHEKPLTLSRSGTALLLVCVSLLAAAGLYAWLVCETFSTRILPSPAGSGDVLMNGLRDFPLIFLLSLAGGFACGALVSITLRRQGFMTYRSYL